MRTGCLIALIGLSLASGPVTAEPLEQPTVKTTFQIESEQGGSCSELHAGQLGAPPTLNMTDVCHGWTTTSCADMLLVRSIGVIEDQAQVLFTQADRTIDLVSLVDQRIGARPGHEHLHLQFGAASCDGGTLVQRFSGSHMRTKAEGAAAALEGVIRISGPGDHQVSVRSAR